MLFDVVRGKKSALIFQYIGSEIRGNQSPVATLGSEIWIQKAQPVLSAQTKRVKRLTKEVRRGAMGQSFP